MISELMDEKGVGAHHDTFNILLNRGGKSNTTLYGQLKLGMRRLMQVREPTYESDMLETGLRLTRHNASQIKDSHGNDNSGNSNNVFCQSYQIL